MNVSVIIPTYNAGQFIERAIQSVAKQSIGSLEVIVVDDASDDDTVVKVERLKSVVPNLQLIRLSQNSGLPAIPRNVGLKAANGEYVAFLDADDYWVPWKLERQHAYLQDQLDCDLVHSYIWSFRSRSFVPGLIHLSNPLRRRGSYERVTRANPVALSTVFARRHALLEKGGFSPDPHLRIVEDYDLWIRMAKSKPLKYLSEIHGYREERSGSISSRADFDLLHRYLDGLHGSQTSKRTPVMWRLTRKILGFPLALYFHLVEAPIRRRLGLKPRGF